MNTCFPDGLGVPTVTTPGGWPVYSGGPVWWSTTAGPMPFMNARLDDPRWVGARRMSHPQSGSGAAGEHMAFRALRAPDPSGTGLGNCVYLSWHVKVDPSLDHGNDWMVTGFYNPALSSQAVIAIFTPFPSAPPPTNHPDVASTDFTVGFFVGTLSGGAWTWQTPPEGGLTVPAWLAPSTGYTRAWADALTNRWAVELLVPLTAGAAYDASGMNLGASFKFFYHVEVTTPGNPLGVERHQWPPLAKVPYSRANFPDPATEFGDVTFGGANDPACAAGISLSSGDLGVQLPAPATGLGNTISFLSDWFNKDPSLWPTNTLHAKPWNRSGSPIPAHGISARFRLANWGSLPDWDDPSLKGQLWTDIRNGGDVQNEAVINDQQQGDAHFDWKLDDIPGELPAFAPQTGTPTKRDHQCMLVEMSAGPGATGTLNFVNDSVYTNMEVVGASTFEREAEISVKTLGTAGGSHREVYLYVETLNMPENTTPAQERDRRAAAEKARTDRLAAIADELPPESPPQNGGNGPIGLSEDGGEGEGPIQEWFVPTVEDLEAQWPMYRVHAWYDSGERTQAADGTTRKVLRAMSSFGYLVDHQGDLYGWDHQMTGAQLQEISPRFYRLRVPNEGTTTVKTTIVGHDKPRAKGGCLGLLLAFIAFLRRLFS